MDFKQLLNDPKEKAKFQLILFAIFIVFTVVIIRITNNDNIKDNKINEINNKQSLSDNILNKISNSYSYNIDILLTKEVSLNEYEKINIKYGGIKADYEEIISKSIDNKIFNYYLDNGIYYFIDDVLKPVSVNEIYDYLDYRYLDLNNIKKYLNISKRINETFFVKINDINSNLDEDKYINITLNQNIEQIDIYIDYTNLFLKDDILNCEVTISIDNINKITSDDIKSQKTIEKK